MAIVDFPGECLSRLDPNAAVKLVEKLVQTDARQSGITPNIISFPSEINVKDGGIDGKVDQSTSDGLLGTIKKGLTCYQVKSGKQKLDKAGIRKLFCARNGDLKPEIKKCLESQGTLVVVLTGFDSPITNEIMTKISECVGIEDPRIEIWAQSQLRGFLERCPRLCLLFLKIRDDWSITYEDWAAQESMCNYLSPWPRQDEINQKIRQWLSSESSGTHLRVDGEPGIGKTRLVLEALRPKEFSESCLYTDSPREFLESDRFKYLMEGEDHSRIILVVDGCNDHEMEEYWLKLKQCGSWIKLVTIHNEISEARDEMENLEVHPLDDKQIRDILKSYTKSQYDVSVWSDQCGSSPLLAHFVGKNLASGTNNIFQQPSTANVLDGYIAAGLRLDDPEFRTRKTVLRWISSLKTLAWGESDSDELQILAEQIKSHDGIEIGVVRKTMRDLRRMGMLKGTHYLHITPKMIHVWLWREWCKEYGESEPFLTDVMLAKAESEQAYRNTLEGHMEMFQYAGDASDVNGITRNFFGPDGLADRHALLDTDFGAGMFYMVSRADPDGAVDYLRRYLYNQNRGGLIGSEACRRQMTEILAQAAKYRHLFKRSVWMLLWLIGPGGNGSSGETGRVFSNLFLPIPGPVGRTDATPTERLPLLKEALGAEYTECRLAGILACEAALQTRDFIRNIGDDEAWQRVKPWVTKSRSAYTEYTEYYAGVLNIIREHLGRLEGSERSKLVEVVLSRTRGLLAARELHGVVLSLLDTIHAKQYVDNEPIVKTVSECLTYGRDTIPVDLRKNLEQLRNKVTGSSYGALLKRYVSMNIMSELRDKDGVRQKTWEELAEQSLDVKRLAPELDWLVTDKAVYGHGFGYALGRIDGGALFSRIRGAQRRHMESKAYFLGGYLSAVFQRNVGEWENLMDSLAEDPVLHPRVPALTHMSGMTDRAATRIRDLVKSGLDPMVLRDFVFGTLVRAMSEEIFEEWIQLLADDNARTYGIALNLYHRYYVHNNMRIPDSARELLFPSDNADGVLRVSGESAYFWSDILASYIKQHPDQLDMIGRALKMVMNGSYLHSSLRDELLPALIVAAERDPAKTWEMIADFINPAKNKPGAYWNVKWLLSMDGAALVDKISLEVIFKWTDRDKEKRAPLVAYLIPNDIYMATKFVAKYGEISRVARILIDNLNSESISGPMSKHYEEKIAAVDSLMEKESGTVVLEFLQEYKGTLVELRDSDWPLGLGHE